VTKLRPDEIDTEDNFKSSEWGKYEPEEVARHIVKMAQAAGGWYWFTRAEYATSRWPPEERQSEFWPGDYDDEMYWLTNMVHENYLREEYGYLWPDEYFSRRLRLTKKREKPDERSLQGGALGPERLAVGAAARQAGNRV
jgi:hypothetical protein